jgi:flagellar protein FlaF
MGFSVSGAAAVIFIAGFIAFGMFYTATANSAEQITEARQDVQDRQLAERNTDIIISNATYNASIDRLSVTVTNNGTRTLDTTATDLLADNDYQTTPDTTVAGDPTTTLWQPGEALELNSTVTTEPNRVTVVTEHGVADTEVL